MHCNRQACSFEKQPVRTARKPWMHTVCQILGMGRGSPSTSRPVLVSNVALMYVPLPGTRLPWLSKATGPVMPEDTQAVQTQHGIDQW
jgi:hypothetical protein